LSDETCSCIAAVYCGCACVTETATAQRGCGFNCNRSNLWMHLPYTSLISCGQVIFTLLVAAVGYSARLKRSSRIMVVYVALVTIPMLVFLTALGVLVQRTFLYGQITLLLRSNFNSEFQDIVTDNRGVESNFMSVTWNVWMVKYNCCGLDRWDDFAKTRWMQERNVSYAGLVTRPDDVRIPTACCKRNASTQRISADLPVAERCYYEPEDKDLANGHNGCRRYIEKLLDGVCNFLLSLCIAVLATVFFLWMSAVLVTVRYRLKEKQIEEMQNEIEVDNYIEARDAGESQF
jgi:hypothetical protein